ncbi:hypothetical protein PM082_001873 [Marasmius tenuissimus]|nr:hypothetical protein PM082_001873 [Marasmius tenuissimus]
MSGTNAKFEEDINYMKEFAHKIVQNRRENPIEKKDLLNTMLFGKDPKTGEGLSDEAIVNNVRLSFTLKCSLLKTVQLLFFLVACETSILASSPIGITHSAMLLLLQRS